MSLFVAILNASPISMFKTRCMGMPWPGVATYTCNIAALEAEFSNGVGSLPIGGNTPSIDGWIV